VLRRNRFRGTTGAKPNAECAQVGEMVQSPEPFPGVCRGHASYHRCLAYCRVNHCLVPAPPLPPPPRSLTHCRVAEQLTLTDRPISGFIFWCPLPNKQRGGQTALETLHLPPPSNPENAIFRSPARNEFYYTNASIRPVRSNCAAKFAANE